MGKEKNPNYICLEYWYPTITKHYLYVDDTEETLGRAIDRYNAIHEDDPVWCWYGKHGNYAPTFDIALLEVKVPRRFARIFEREIFPELDELLMWKGDKGYKDFMELHWYPMIDRFKEQ